ncbi:MAG: rRNA pseudouridine synthase [Vampirovibrio sp.]|nr:rRNA pseudouridine synthase [Vampirovibrio sp.]
MKKPQHTPKAISSSSIRLNKHIANSGVCSRREADRLITNGQVTINGIKVSELGISVNPATDEIKVSGHFLPKIRRQYVLFHKPKGVITTRSDEKGRKSLYDVLPKKYHSLDPAGRLDRDSSGALILSNDGDFIYQVTHPKFHVPKVYQVTLDRPVSPTHIRKLTKGITLEPEGKLAQLTEVIQTGPKKLQVVLLTGYNRQIRRSFEAIGYEVTMLKRTAIGPVGLGNLRPGACRFLSPMEMKTLRGKQ